LKALAPDFSICPAALIPSRGISAPYGFRNLRIFTFVAAVCILSGCKTQSTMTAGVTGCSTIGVDIVKSRYSREGSTTRWCAKCKNKLYFCVSNPEHSRVECKEAVADTCE
jgi:hypothetical protein